MSATASRAQKVLYVIGGLGTGGAERQLLELCSSLDRAKWDPVVCSLDAGHEYRAAFADRGIRVVELPRKGSFDVARLGRLRALVRQEQPALVHAFLIGPSLYTRLAFLGLRSRPRLVVAERSVKPRQRWIVRQVDRALAWVPDCWIANADAVRRALAGMLAPTRPEIEVIPNGFDPSEIDGARPRDTVRAELGWGDESVVLLVGRLAPAKDFPTLIAAFARLADRPGVRFSIAGEGPERANVESLIREHGVRVELLGLRSDVPDLLAAADVLVLSSSVEGFPNVVGEALLAGLPVAATAAGGVPEVLRDGVDGLVVPVGNAGALADALGVLLDDPARAREMAARGNRRMRAEFSVEAMVAKTTALYERLLSAPSSSAR